MNDLKNKYLNQGKELGYILKKDIKLDYDSPEYSSIEKFLMDNDIYVVESFDLNNLDYTQQDILLDNEAKLYLNEVNKIKDLSLDEQLNLLKNGDEYSKNKLIEANLKLVYVIASNFTYSNIPILDLIQEGNMGLIKAINKYDFKCDFKSYITWWIKEAILNSIKINELSINVSNNMALLINKLYKIKNEYYIKNKTDISKEELSKKLGVSIEVIDSLEKIAFDTKNINNIDDNKMKVNIDNALMDLSLLERTIINKKYGINEKASDYFEISKELNISIDRIKQIENRALKKLKNKNLNKEVF